MGFNSAFKGLIFMLHILDRNTKETLVLSYEVVLERILTRPVFIEMSNRFMYCTWILYLIFPVKISIDTRRLTKHLTFWEVSFSVLQTVVQVRKFVICGVPVVKIVRYTLLSLFSLQVFDLDGNCY